MSEFEKPGNAEAAAWLDGTDLRSIMDGDDEAPEVKPPDTRTAMQLVNVRLPVDVVEAIGALAAERGGQSRSEIIRVALTQYLERETGPVPQAEAEHALDIIRRIVHRSHAA